MLALKSIIGWSVKRELDRLQTENVQLMLECSEAEKKLTEMTRKVRELQSVSKILYEALREIQALNTCTASPETAENPTDNFRTELTSAPEIAAQATELCESREFIEQCRRREQVIQAAEEWRQSLKQRAGTQGTPFDPDKQHQDNLRVTLQLMQAVDSLHHFTRLR